MSETQSLDEFVKEQLQTGKYASYEDLVAAGIRLLRERENELDWIVDELSPAVKDYLNGDRGETLDIEAMKRQGRNRLADMKN
ncbi:MAG: hypothetical protein ETSY2_12790 [Candidatus Entotheonella gemina]|uniref:CopG family transcriptional regulator n=1 Tax=Candidatus Entotheonella gemina TaxID=1429439 RepID=W4M9V9_9BACT|nr:MAG: hypothetical protein ETSY2_12790 [Candidatus Entotheonella gemina]